MEEKPPQQTTVLQLLLPSSSERKFMQEKCKIQKSNENIALFKFSGHDLKGLVVLFIVMSPVRIMRTQYVGEWLSVGGRLAFSLALLQQLTRVCNFCFDFTSNYGNKEQQLNALIDNANRQ